jgi:hypothetical protein
VERNSLMSRAGRSIDSSPWLLPGVLAGAYALTRLPFGLLAGLAVGFAAGWTLRAEQSGGRSDRAADDRTRHRESSDVPTAEEDEKVDEMVDESFPASDPPSYTPTRAGKPKAARN